MEIIANFFDAIGDSEMFASKLFNNYCEAMDNIEDDDVIAKSIYGIGVIIATSGQTGPSLIPKAISKLPLGSDIDPKIAVSSISARSWSNLDGHYLPPTLTNDRLIYLDIFN